MFRLYEPAFEAALEDWGKLSRRLQAEKENQQMIMNTMSQAWVGKTQQDFDYICKDLVTTGLYQQTAEIVERIYRIQYDLLPKIIAQMARCEKLPEQLEQDAYIPPYLSGYGYYNDGQLALDEDYVAGCNAAAEEVVMQATEMKNLLYRAMDACGGLIDFTEEKEELEAGYRKVKRIEHFQTEFNKYVTEVKEIEEELITGFRAVMAADPDPANLKWKAVLQNLNMKGNSLYTMQQLSSVRLSAGVASYLERMNVFTVSPNLQELVQINEEGIYTFEELLQKDMSELTDAELQKLKSLYQEICESIEQADGKDACLIQKDMLERYLKNLYKLEIVYEYSYYGGKSVDEYKVVSKDELILALLDEDNESTLANNMLNSIYGTETKIERSWYSGWFASGMVEEIETQALVDVKLELTEVGCAFSVICCPDASKREKHADEGVMEHYATSEIRARNYVDSLDANTLQRIDSFGYTNEEIAKMYYITQNKSDIVFLNKIFSGEYKEAFDIPVDKLGDNTKMSLGYFGIRLGELMETGNTELQDFVNAILYVDENRCYDTGYFPEDYLELFVTQTGAIREIVTASLLSGERTGIEAKEYSRDVNELYSFWFSLYEMMDDGDVKVSDTDDLWFSRGECVVQMSGLEKENGDICYQLNLHPSNDISRITKTFTMEAFVEWLPDEVPGDYNRQLLNDIKKETDLLLAAQSADVAIGLLTIYCPTAGTVLKSIQTQCEGLTVSGGISDGVKIPKIKDNLSKDKRATLNILQNITGYMEAKKALDKKLKATAEEGMLGWFYSANQYHTGLRPEDNHYIEHGIYNYDVIQGINTWSTSGLGFLLVDESLYPNLTEEEMKDLYVTREDALLDILKEKGLNELEESDKNALLYLMYGNTVSENVPEYTGEYQSVVEMDQVTFLYMVNVISDNLSDDCSDYGETKISQIWDNQILQKPIGQEECVE